MPDEGESPSVGWSAVYHEMGVSTVTDPDEWRPFVTGYSSSGKMTAETEIHTADE